MYIFFGLKLFQKKCHPDKILSPKGRCVIDRSKSKLSKKKNKNDSNTDESCNIL